MRIIDIGGSYKKIARILGARYLDFQPGTTVCLNPFSNIEEPEEELKSVTAVFAQMAYSNSDTDRCDDTELNMVRNAVRWAWQQCGQAADADTVYDFLARFPDVPDADFDSMGDNPAWSRWRASSPSTSASSPATASMAASLSAPRPLTSTGTRLWCWSWRT